MTSPPPAPGGGPAPRPGLRLQIPYLRWVMAVLLLMVTIINYLDRNIFSIVIATPEFHDQFRINDQQLGYIVFSFALTYGIMQAFSGRLIDWIGTRRGFSLAVLFWSVANISIAWAGHFHAWLGSLGFASLTAGNVWISFALFRALLGVGEAGNFPCAIKTIAQWFPPRERTIATGVFNTGASIGATIAPLIGAYLISTWGWQSAFLVTGGVGFVWIALWLAIYQTPEEHRWITPQEREHINRSIAEMPAVDATATTGVWRLVLSSPAFWALAFMRFMSEPAWQFASNWIPKYFKNTQGFDLKTLAWFTFCTFLASDLGSIIGGFLSPWFHKRGHSLLTARRLAATSGAVLMLAIIVTPFTTEPWIALACLSIAAFAHQSISATVLTLPADLFPSRAVATANGLSGCFGYIGGALFMLVVGYMFQHQQYIPLFLMMGIFDLVGVCALWMFLRPR